MTETPNVTPHLLFDDNGTILCGAQNHYAKRPKANAVVIDIIKPERRFQPEEGTYALTKDGMKVTIGSAFCGTHKPGHGALVVPPYMVASLLSSPALLLDYAKDAYEKRADEHEARVAADLARWDAARQRAHAEVTFTVREVDRAAGFDGSVKTWLIEGHSPERDEPFPVTIVAVQRDGGVLWVSTSDYLNSGPGRGNPSWTTAFRAALHRAAVVQENADA